MRSYSQNGEDSIISKYFNKEKGIYLDIGAGHYKNNSNTYGFYKLGWRGLIIEPHPDYKVLIIKNRPKDIFLPYVIADYDGEIKMYTTISASSNLLNWAKEKYKNDSFIVKCITINTLLKKYPKFKEPDFVSIDIEAGEEKLLSVCNFEVFKPTLIVIEYKCRSENGEGQMNYKHKWLKHIEHYYELKEENGSNAFYLRKN